MVVIKTALSDTGASPTFYGCIDASCRAAGVTLISACVCVCLSANYSGMGGSVGFADLEAGLGVAILKSGYTATLARMSSLTPGVEELIRCIRTSLHCS